MMPMRDRVRIAAVTMLSVLLMSAPLSGARAQSVETVTVNGRVYSCDEMRRAQAYSRTLSTQERDRQRREHGLLWSQIAKIKIICRL